MSSFALDRFDTNVPSFETRDFDLPPGEPSLGSADGSVDDLLLAQSPDGKAEQPDEAEVQEHQALAATLGRLLADIRQNWDADCQATVQDIADRAGRSVSELLPNFVDTFGRRQLSASVVAILERAKPDAPELILAPDDHDAVVEILSSLNSHVPLKVRKSESQSPASGCLKWHRGGAEIDLADFLMAAKYVFDSEHASEPNGASAQ